MRDGNLGIVQTCELIAIVVAVIMQCDFCIDTHAKRTIEAGATPQEAAEATMVATALRAGGGAVHGAKTMGAIAESTGPITAAGGPFVVAFRARSPRAVRGPRPGRFESYRASVLHGNAGRNKRP